MSGTFLQSFIALHDFIRPHDRFDLGHTVFVQSAPLISLDFADKASTDRHVLRKNLAVSVLWRLTQTYLGSLESSRLGGHAGGVVMSRKIFS